MHKKFHFSGSALVGILDEVDEHLLQLGTVGRQLSSTLGLYLWVESCDMSKEFADGEGRPLGCFDTRQLAVAFYEVEQRVAAAVDDGTGLVLVG